MEFEIIENSTSCIRVSVRLQKRKKASDPNLRVATTDVIAFLKREGARFTDCVEHTAIDNYAENPRLYGEWCFKKKSTKKKRDNNVSNSEKTTRRRRPRKPSTKENKLLGTENLE